MSTTLDELFRRKLPVEWKPDMHEWERCQLELIQACFRKGGMHQDELESYNSYLPEIIGLLKEHIQVKYVDSQQRLHCIDLVDAWFVRPYEQGTGIDSVESALLRSSYESEVHGVVRYQIRTKVANVDADASAMGAVDMVDDAAESSDEEAPPEEEDDDLFDDDLADEPELQSQTSRNTSTKPAFFIDKDNYSSFSVVEFESYDNHHIMNIPVFIRSDLCWMSSSLSEMYLYDRPYLTGCAYMVSRTFKLCPYEEFYSRNRILRLRTDQVEYRSTFLRIDKRFRTNSTLKFSIEYPNMKKIKSWSITPRFRFEIPHETKPPRFCPITVLAMAYGWSIQEFLTSVRQFIGVITEPMRPLLDALEADTGNCHTQHDAIMYISKLLSKCKTMNSKSEIMSYVSFTIRGEYFPNLVDVNVPDNGDHTYENMRKGYAIAEAAAQLIHIDESVNYYRSDAEKRRIDDTRSYTMKRIDTPGEKMTYLVRKYAKHYAKKASTKLQKDVDAHKGVDLQQILNIKMIKLTKSVKNGIWDSRTDANKSNQNKTQMMITGFCSDHFHTQVQKIIKFAMEKNSDPEPLLTHPTQQGRVCLYVTPESDRCGIVRNKSLGAHITPFVNLHAIDAMIRRLLDGPLGYDVGWTPLAPPQPGAAALPPDVCWTQVKDVFGGIIGWVQHPFVLYQRIVSMRRQGQLWRFLGIEWDRLNFSVYFNADEGRMMRPLIVLERVPDLMRIISTNEYRLHDRPFDHLVDLGILEYLDPSEEYCGTVFTAESLDASVASGHIFTHLEVHAVFSLSLTVAKAFCNFNQGPRRMYTGNMEKQSIALKSNDDRGTTVTYALWHGQDPLLSDPVDDALQSRHKEPNGTNVVIAILADAYNIEDSYVFKKEAVERGACATSETMVTTRVAGHGISFKRPSGTTKGRAMDDRYDGLNDDGTPALRAQLKGGMASIGMVFRKKADSSGAFDRCVSKFLPWNSAFSVKSVQTYPPNAEPQDTKIIRASLNKKHYPEVGDKFFMAHGQKGTLSCLRPAIDMPFIESGPMAGVSPDMLVNPCALMRVTIGLLLELLYGKCRALNPMLIEQYRTIGQSATTFEDQKRLCSAVLQANGLKASGKERMRQGTTGEEIECDVYVGMAYLRVLKHMSRDKSRSRERGPVNELTRQPTAGKVNLGGPRWGEMENWNLHSYGMSAAFKNFNYESADKFDMYLCTKCSIRAIGSPEIEFYMCPSCKRSEDVVKMPTTYISNLTMSELYACGIGMKVLVNDDKVPKVDFST